ncbi:MAG UNVERIFIED_CONTAM: hypothetical protein LVR18_07870 [Planctomycetaceae bacterium]
MLSGKTLCDRMPEFFDQQTQRPKYRVLQVEESDINVLRNKPGQVLQTG